MRGAERRQHVGQPARGERRQHRDRDAPAPPRRVFAEVFHRGLEVAQQAARALEEQASFGGPLDLARVAVEQPHRDRVLERADQRAEPVVVENKAGAGGMLAAQSTARVVITVKLADAMRCVPTRRRPNGWPACRRPVVKRASRRTTRCSGAERCRGRRHRQPGRPSVFVDRGPRRPSVRRAALPQHRDPTARVRLIPNDKLHEVLYEAANAPPGNNAHKGALAHLTRAAEVLDRVQLARGAALAFDPTQPQNPAQAAQNQAFNANAKAPQPASTETAARLPQLDKPLVDADLYYRQDNRGALARLLGPLLPTASNTAAVDDREREVDRECVCRRGQRLAHAPRPEQSAAAAAGLAADCIPPC